MEAREALVYTLISIFLSVLFLFWRFLRSSNTGRFLSLIFTVKSLQRLIRYVNPPSHHLTAESNQSEFMSYMDSKSKSVHKALEEAIQLCQPVLKISEAMRDRLLSGGNPFRVRPLLCLAACEVVGGHDSTAIPAACAVEMIHASSLTTHKVFSENISILAADALIALAIEQMVASASLNVPPERVLWAIEGISKTVGTEGLIGGEAANLAGEGMTFEDDVIGLEHLEFTRIHKTAALMEAAVVSGAIMGGGSEEEIESLRNYARCIGLMFQVVEDVLDITKSSEECGKIAGEDLVTEQLTYPKLMRVEKSQEYAEKLNTKAREHLKTFDSDKAAPLLLLADYIVNRKN